MREAIREALTAIAEVGERVFEPHAAGADTEKPYIVISMGQDVDESDWAGFRRGIEIWPNVARTSFVNVDSLAQSIIETLSEPLTTESGGTFSCIYEGVVGDDVVDVEWDIITRGLRFTVLALQPIPVAEEVPEDPWLTALASWTEGLLDNWTVYTNKWPLGYQKPCILWRGAGEEIQDLNRAVYKETKTLICHVLGDTPNGQLKGAQSIVAGLWEAFKIEFSENEGPGEEEEPPIEPPNGDDGDEGEPVDEGDETPDESDDEDGNDEKQKRPRYLTVERVKANFQADALTAGQVTAVLSRVVMRKFTSAPLMQEVAFKLKKKKG